MPLSDDQLISLVRRDDLLTPQQVRQAREASRMTGKPLLEIIRERGWLDDAEMAHVEAAAAIVRPPGTPAAGSSATFIGSLATLEGSDSDRPTAVPAMRGATPVPPLRRPAPDPAAAPEPERPVSWGVLLVAAILAVAIVVAMLAGLGKFVHSSRRPSQLSAPATRV